jgi:DNA polymerase III delta prime subunit
MNIPWVEKYRPNNFENIILDNFNRTLLSNILKKKYFPNMIFHGPPGTGKTTTVINLINSFNNIINEKTNNIIHLNASDDRGIETIRTLIYNFINSKNMFSKNKLKFVILDEVDCITKLAQQALKYIIQSNNKNIRFCLICNYISKIDYSLQSEFVKIKFNKLPKENIIHFLNNIIEQENLNYSIKELEEIQNLFESDIRSMINYIQNNYNFKVKIIDNNILEEILKLHTKNVNKKNKENFINFFYYLSFEYNKDILEIIQQYLQYIIINKKYNNKKILDTSELILHNQSRDILLFLNLIYFINI